MKEIEMKALKIKQDREANLRKIEEDKNREEFEEGQRTKKVKEKSQRFKNKLKVIISVILFAGIVGFHLAISLLQRDYTGVDISFRHYAQGIIDHMNEYGVLFIIKIGI